MIVQHNMSAANANRQLGINATNLSKSTEKLSSGYRINRAGDDAAGLTISEKMRGQIRGLDQASSNAQDGISLIQTAEGALDETTNILQRMRELSVQGANDTNTAEDRAAIEEEMKALTSEIDRIANNTEFNTQNLLDGSFKGSFQIGANANQTIDLKINTMDSGSLGLTSGSTISFGSGVAVTGIKDGSYTVDGANLKDANGNTVGTIDADGAITSANDGATASDSTHPVTSGSTIKIEDGKVTSIKLENQGSITATTGFADTDTQFAAGTYTIKDGKILDKDNAIVGEYTTGKLTNYKGDGKGGTNADVDTVITEATIGFTGGLRDGDTFTVGATGGKITSVDRSYENAGIDKLAAGEYTVSGSDVLIGDKLVGTLGTGAESAILTLKGTDDKVDLEALGLNATDLSTGKSFTINGIDVSNSSSASGSTTTIDNAIKAVSKQRSQLGAVQNRLEHTISNLDNSSENLQSAESRIRDVDMASEMVSYSKSNILQQAAQSMLAQAKNSTQGVLSLLQ